MLRTILCLLFCVFAMTINIDDPNINVPGWIEHMLTIEMNNFTSLTEIFQAADNFRIEHGLPLHNTP